MARIPSPELVEEAKKFPNGWVYEILSEYGPADHVPPYAIMGAWKVDADGRIVGDFVANPNFGRGDPDRAKWKVPSELDRNM